MIVLYQPFQNPTIPCPAPSRLPPLSKGGGLTARHKLLLCCVLLAICPLFLYCKLFAVKTEGLLYHLSLSTTSMPPLSKGGGLTASHKLSLCCILIATHPPFLFTKLFCRQDRGIASSPSLTCTNPPKPTLSLSLFVGEGLVSRVTWFTLCASTWFTCYQ